MKQAVFMLLVLLSVSVFAQESQPIPQAQEGEIKEDSSAVQEVQVSEEQRLCEKNSQRLQYKLQELSVEDRKRFDERIRNEFAICKSDEKCVCEIYTYMLAEIDKEQNRAVIPVADVKEEKKEKTVEEMADDYERGGKIYRGIGTGILIPGVLFGTYGLLALAVFLPVLEAEEWAISGGCSLLGATPHIIVGAVLVSKGNKKIKKANELRSKEKVSFGLTPVIEPKSRYYGAAFSMSF